LRKAGLIEAALDRVVAVSEHRNQDLEGPLATRAFAAWVMEAIRG